MSTPNEKEETEDDLTENGSPGKKGELNLSLAPYVLLAALRVVLTLVPQTGYVQPDEYFQSIEIVTEDIFDVEASRPWEFNVTKPIRSAALPYLYAGLPLFVLKCVAPFIKLWFEYDMVTPYFLVVIPRLTCCLLSFLNDLCLFKICNIYGQNYRARLLTLASSYVLLVYGTRTFSNTIEMTLTSVLIYFVADCMHRSDQVIYQDEYLQECYNKAENMREKVRLNRLRKSLPGHSFSSCLIIASISVLGVFNRPTFIAFAFTPIFFWLHRGLGSKNIGLPEFHLRIVLLGLCALPMTVFLILVDSFYFGYLTWNEIIQKKISLESNFVMTPYNFIQYNAYTSNLANHGLHPRVTHLLLNVPLLYNVLGVAAICAVLSLLYRIIRQRWSELPRIQSIIGLMTSACIIPIALLSIFPHQEPRFIIPITLPLVFLHSQRIRNVHDVQQICEKQDKGLKVFIKKEVSQNYKDKILSVWYLLNMILVLVYGFVHQAGVYPLLDHMSVVMKEKPRLTAVHLVTSFVYPLPISLLRLQHAKTFVIEGRSGLKRYQTARDFFTYEMGLSDTVENAAKKVREVVGTSEKIWQEKRLKYKVFLAIPTSRLAEFEINAYKMNITYFVEQIFYPHVATEAMPDFSLGMFTKCEGFTESECQATISNLSLDFPLHYFSHIIDQCGLALVKINKIIT
ncbi:GPI mannosyltransferase 4-like [Homalodisca vitripennis]|uniref:GPI mannosyltransferase 4-like n=1 Tax=Homalodisca vitripennis TaxID=197043 RepID=UPI001EEBCCC0|nr:GPI mannosyltransferase 4-like [Homalodisca vitripennis]XP_046685951.1 GPI mannosyltransferase 4-like [Homalodisca vitripennis]